MSAENTTVREVWKRLRVTTKGYYKLVVSFKIQKVSVISRAI